MQALPPLPLRPVARLACAVAATLLLTAGAAASAGAAPAGPAAGSAAFSPQRIVAAANAERVRHGLPRVRLRADWAASCAKHVSWIQQNGVLSHQEQPGTPGYTAEGAWAGMHAILAMGAPWSSGNPWATAPIHLNQMMAPQLRAVGAFEADGTACLTTWPGMSFAPTAEPRFASWPGDGVDDVAPAVVARELPFVPGQFVGLPEGAETGPNMMVYAIGWDRVRIVAATLRPAGGAPVAVRTVDRSHESVGPYLVPGSGFVIPVRPLAPGTAYTATARVRNVESGLVRTTTWRFTTAGDGPALLGG